MSTTPQNARPRRGRLQFSLSGLGVAIAVFGLALAWVSHERNRVQKRMNAIAAIEELGGIVQFDESQPFRPRWLRPLLGDTSAGEVVEVRFLGGKANDAGLVHLTGLSKLEMLWLDQTPVGDAGLVHLAGLTNLATLRASETRITDAGLVYLAGLKKLKVLRLDETAVTDAGLAHLASLANLEALYLSQTNVTDAGLVHLAGLTNLQRLYLDETQVSDAGLFQLARLTKLERLWLDHTLVTEKGVRTLQLSLPNTWIVQNVGELQEIR